jgi:hypothetical protein
MDKLATVWAAFTGHADCTVCTGNAVCGSFPVARSWVVLGRGYIEARTDTTQQSGQTPDKEADINTITVYVSGCTETDPTGMLSPNNGRLSGSNRVVLFGADSLARYLLQCA